MNAKSRNKLFFLLAGAIIVTLFFLFDLQQYLSLEFIKQSQSRFAQLYEERQLLIISIYMGIYILVTGMSLPGAMVLTLAGGALFGLTVGTIVISFASTIGATLACLISRFLLRDMVEDKFGDKLVTINQGISEEGAFYLFTLRLIPIFPFFVINLVLGLSQMGLFTFYWVSQLGMLPGTIVFVNAGKELAKIDSPAGILSPTLLASFAILGLFPITVKKMLTFYKKRKSADIGEQKDTSSSSGQK
ncbi:MAG: TVP38/TMEM64 family protein [Thermodesulfobacteriota bacterium]